MEWIRSGDVTHIGPAQMPFYGNRDMVCVCIVDDTCIMPYLSNYAPVSVGDSTHRRYTGVVVSEGRVYLTHTVSSLKRAMAKTEGLYYSVLGLCS